MVWFGETRPALKSKYPVLLCLQIWTEEAEILKHRYKEEMARVPENRCHLHSCHQVKVGKIIGSLSFHLKQDLL